MLEKCLNAVFLINIEISFERRLKHEDKNQTLETITWPWIQYILIFAMAI